MALASTLSMVCFGLSITTDPPATSRPSDFAGLDSDSQSVPDHHPDFGARTPQKRALGRHSRSTQRRKTPTGWAGTRYGWSRSETIDGRWRAYVALQIQFHKRFRPRLWQWLRITTSLRSTSRHGQPLTASHSDLFWPPSVRQSWRAHIPWL